MNGIKLFVDDMRTAPEGWHRAHSVTEAIRILATVPVEIVSLDHDIVFFTEDPADKTKPFARFSGEFSEETFATVARYIAIMPDADRPRRVYIHTANPDGAKDIKAILLNSVPELIRINCDFYKDELATQEEDRINPS